MSKLKQYRVYGRFISDAVFTIEAECEEDALEHARDARQRDWDELCTELRIEDVEVEEDTQCESGCGPATHSDPDGVPLCEACYEDLLQPCGYPHCGSPHAANCDACEDYRDLRQCELRKNEEMIPFDVVLASLEKNNGNS